MQRRAVEMVVFMESKVNQQFRDLNEIVKSKTTDKAAMKSIFPHELLSRTAALEAILHLMKRRRWKAL